MMGVSPGSKWASQFEILDKEDVEMAREKCVVIVYEQAMAGLSDIQRVITELAKLAREANQMRQDEVREAEAAFEEHRRSVRDEEGIALSKKKDEKDTLLRQLHGAAFSKYERRLLNARSSFNSAMLLFETRARTLCTSSLEIRTSKTCACWGIYHEDVLLMDVSKGSCRFVLLGTVGGRQIYRHLGNNLEYIRDQYGAFTRRYLIRCLEDGEYQSLFTIGLPCKTLLRDREPALKSAEREAKTAVMRALPTDQKRGMASLVDAELQRKLKKWTGNAPGNKVPNATLEPLLRTALKGTATKGPASIGSWKCKLQGTTLCQEWLLLPPDKQAEAMYWHVREGSTKGSYLISFACTKHPIFGSTGLPFHRLEKGLVIIDAAKLPCSVIDVHAPTTTVALGKLLQLTEPGDWRVGKPAQHNIATTDKRVLNLTGKVSVTSDNPWERTVRDFLRTREVLVAVNVPVEAVVCRYLHGTGWQHNAAYTRGKIEGQSKTSLLQVEPKSPEFGSVASTPQKSGSSDEDLMSILSRHFGGHFS